MSDMNLRTQAFNKANLKRRRAQSKAFEYFCSGVTGLAVVVLALLLYDIFTDGYRWVDAQFLNSFPSRFPEKAGIKSALVGTLWLVGFTAIIAIPTGVLAAIYLEEYAPKNQIGRAHV